MRLVYDWNDSSYKPRMGRALAGALAVQAILALLLDGLPAAPRRAVDLPEVRVERKRVTPLIAPRPFELTQKEANRGKISKDVTLEQLLPKPAQQAQNTPPPAPRPAPRQFVAPQQQVRNVPREILTDPPPLAPMPGNPQVQVPVAAQQFPPPVEKPKLAFENPGGAPTGSPTGTGKLAAPKGGLEEAMRQAARKGVSGGVVVSDVMDLASGAGATLSATPNQGKAGSSLELLSDPQGVDFKPYLIRVLAAVRRNWFAVIPESAKLGQRGRVIIQFAISKEGRVPRLVISYPSGTESFDRAAVAGISASNPFPPLPAEFKGEQIRLQLSFLYNMPSQ